MLTILKIAKEQCILPEDNDHWSDGDSEIEISTGTTPISDKLHTVSLKLLMILV